MIPVQHDTLRPPPRSPSKRTAEQGDVSASLPPPCMGVHSYVQREGCSASAILVASASTDLRGIALDRLRPLQTLLIVVVAAGVAVGTAAAFMPALGQRGDNREVLATYLVVANAFLLFAVGALTLLYVDNRRARLRAAVRRNTKVVQLLRHIQNVAGARTTLSMQSLEGAAKDTSFEERAARTTEFLQTLVNETCATFDEYTEHPCAVSIKLLVPGEDGVPQVRSYVRDYRSGAIRRRVYGEGKPYPYTDHSPFVALVRQQPRMDFYLENNLRTAVHGRGYENGNGAWRKFYNATLVLPINPPAMAPNEDLIGFLCIDSLTARFDGDVCPSVARVFASSAFLAIFELTNLQRQHVDATSVTGRGAQTA